MAKKKKIVVGVLIAVLVVGLLWLAAKAIEDFYLFGDDKDAVNIVYGKDTTLYYISQNTHTVKPYKAHVNNSQELFDLWKMLCGLPEGAVLNRMEYQKRGYEEEIKSGNSTMLQYVSLPGIVECDLSEEIYQYKGTDFDTLLDAWVQTVLTWELDDVENFDLERLTISIEGEVVYEQTAPASDAGSDG